jgi:protein SCO1/2
MRRVNRTGLVFVFVLALGPKWAPGEEGEPYRRSVQAYEVPDVTLIDQDGVPQRLPEYLRSERPLLLDFFFASCTTVCPVLSASFASLQKSFGEDTRQARLVSIAIDPEHDTPEVLRTYRTRFGARPGWDLLTGDKADVDRVLKAFAAYVPNKMSHRPVNLLRAPGADEWIRIDGLVGASDLAREYRRLGR